MQSDVKYPHVHGAHHGFCFIKAGLWYFIIGVILGFGCLIHYIVGSAYDNSPNFLANITLWFGSPLTFSSGFLQVAGLAMAILGILFLGAARCTTPPATATTAPETCCPRHKCGALALCHIGLIALIITGYFGYYIIDYFRPGFYYAPLFAAKNLWLVLQGLSVLLYIIGVIIGTCCLCKCKKEMCTRPRS